MGITGLLPFLGDISRGCNISEFRGRTVAIDSYCWLHKGAFSCADKLIRGENTDMYVQYCFKYLNLLLSYNIKPIMVFDGQQLLAKKATEYKRRNNRRMARAQGNEMLRLGRSQEALQYFRQCVDVTHEMALKLIKECRKKNIDCIVAPYEADAQLTYLNLQGLADLIITEDSDLIMFGCDKVLYKFKLNGWGVLVERDNLPIAMNLGELVEYTFDKFRYMCIMSGCDYLESIQGIGLKRAHDAVASTLNPDIYKLLKRLPMYVKGRVVVPEGYIENFKFADATIRHQVVYDPIKRSLVRLTDPEVSGIDEKYLQKAGEMFDNKLAFQLALGNIDPFTKEIVDNWNPDVALSSTNTNSIWSKRFQKSNSNGIINPLNMNKKCISENTPTTSSNNSLVIQEQKMENYDNKLSEELKMYQTYQTVEPPAKKQKGNGDENRSELDGSKSDKVSANNPFIKKKQSEKFSKFEFTNAESSGYIQSRFFTPTSSKTYTRSESVTVDSNFVELADDSSSLQTFANRQTSPVLPYSQPTNKKRYIFSNQTKLRPSVFLNSNYYKKETINHGVQKCNTNTEDSKMSLECDIAKIYISSDESDENQTVERGSDIENLTPEDKNTEMVNSIDTLYHFERSEQLTATCNPKRVMQVHNDNVFTTIDSSSTASSTEIDNEVVGISVNKLENIPFSQEVKSTPQATGQFKKPYSGRPVGLSRNKKKVTNQRNQPTLLSMFSKMSSRN